jgi:hypothetical protein
LDGTADEHRGAQNMYRTRINIYEKRIVRLEKLVCMLTRLETKFIVIYLIMAQQPLVGWGLLILEASRSHSVIHTTICRAPLDE